MNGFFFVSDDCCNAHPKEIGCAQWNPSVTSNLQQQNNRQIASEPDVLYVAIRIFSVERVGKKEIDL